MSKNNVEKFNAEDLRKFAEAMKDDSDMEATGIDISKLEIGDVVLVNEPLDIYVVRGFRESLQGVVDSMIDVFIDKAMELLIEGYKDGLTAHLSGFTEAMSKAIMSAMDIREVED